MRSAASSRSPRPNTGQLFFECATRQTLRATAEQDVSAATSHVRRDRYGRIADPPARRSQLSRRVLRTSVEKFVRNALNRPSVRGLPQVLVEHRTQKFGIFNRRLCQRKQSVDRPCDNSRIKSATASQRGIDRKNNAVGASCRRFGLFVGTHATPRPYVVKKLFRFVAAYRSSRSISCTT